MKKEINKNLAYRVILTYILENGSPIDLFMINSCLYTLGCSIKNIYQMIDQSNKQKNIINKNDRIIMQQIMMDYIEKFKLN